MSSKRARIGALTRSQNPHTHEPSGPVSSSGGASSSKATLPPSPGPAAPGPTPSSRAKQAPNSYAKAGQPSAPREAVPLIPPDVTDNGRVKDQLGLDLLGRLIECQLDNLDTPGLRGHTIERLKHAPNPVDVAHAFAGTPSCFSRRTRRPPATVHKTNGKTGNKASDAASDRTSDKLRDKASGDSSDKGHGDKVHLSKSVDRRSSATPPLEKPSVDLPRSPDLNNPTTCIIYAVRYAGSMLNDATLNGEEEMPPEQIFAFRSIQTMYHWLCGAHMLLSTARTRVTALEKTANTQAELLRLLLADARDMDDADIESLEHIVADVRDIYAAWRARDVHKLPLGDKRDRTRDVFRAGLLRLIVDANARSHARATHDVYKMLEGTVQATTRAEAQAVRLREQLQVEEKKSAALAAENAQLKAEVEALKAAVGAANILALNTELASMRALLEKAEGAVSKAECKIARLEERVQASNDELQRFRGGKLGVDIDDSTGTYTLPTPTTPATKPVPPAASQIKTTEPVSKAPMPAAFAATAVGLEPSLSQRLQDLLDGPEFQAGIAAMVAKSMGAEPGGAEIPASQLGPVEVCLVGGTTPLASTREEPQDDFDHTDAANEPADFHAEFSNKPAPFIVDLMAAAAKDAKRSAKAKGRPSAKAKAVRSAINKPSKPSVPPRPAAPDIVPEDILAELDRVGAEGVRELLAGGGDARDFISMMVEKTVARGCTCDECTRVVQSGLVYADILRDADDLTEDDLSPADLD
ncbi:hypothetical protein Q5752_002807 [Cryptotrichosporon argae]